MLGNIARWLDSPKTIKNIKKNNFTEKHVVLSTMVVECRETMFSDVIIVRFIFWWTVIVCLILDKNDEERLQPN